MKNSLKHIIPILSITWCALAILDSVSGNYFKLSFIRDGWVSMTILTSSLFILLYGIDYLPSNKIRAHSYYALIILSFLDFLAGLLWTDRTFISSISTSLFFITLGVYGYNFEKNINRKLTYTLKISVYYLSSIIVILYFFLSDQVHDLLGVESMGWNTATGFMLFTTIRLPLHFDYLLEKIDIPVSFKTLSKNVLETWLYVSFILPIFILVAITTLHFMNYISSDISISILLFLMIVIPFPLANFLFKDTLRWNKLISTRDEIISDREEELLYFNKQLTEFAQITSHNLRGPIISMVNLSEIAFDEATPDSVKETSFRLLREKIESYKFTIDNLTDYYNMIRQKGVENQVCNLEYFINKAITSTFEDDFHSTSDFELVLDLNAKEVIYPTIYVENIFYNLISNCFKYSKPNQRPIIRISSQKVDKTTTEIKVWDNGLGMDLTYFGDKIFQFGRSYHNFTTSRGTGLFIVKSQLNRLGDDIQVASEEGIFTEFTITISNQHEKKLDNN